MPYADWAGVTHDLTSSLERLDDGDFLIMGEPSVPRGPGHSRLLGPPSSPAPTRYVQALRVDELFVAECVGATSLGGTWDMADGTIEQIRSLGWLTPAESKSFYDNPTPNFEMFVELADASALAELMVASLMVLRTHPDDLLLQTSDDLSALRLTPTGAS